MTDELTVVGCGTVVPEGDRSASSYWVAMGESRILFDCGPGTAQTLARLGLPWHDLTDLAISHFHADHVGALPGILFAFRHALEAERTRPLTVWGPVGTGEFLRRMERTFGDFILDPGFPLLIEEVAPGTPRPLPGGPRLEAHDTPHTDESLAWRLDGAGASFGYSGDTGPCRELGSFLRGVRVLVCECSLPDSGAAENHLSPSQVAEIASKARPGTLILTHVYPRFRERHDVVGLVTGAGYPGTVRLASEGLRAALSPPI